MIEAVEHKLKAYSWNLNTGYEGNPVFRVAEIGEMGRAAMASFSRLRRLLLSVDDPAKIAAGE